MQIRIDAELGERGLALGLVQARVTVTGRDEALWREIDAHIDEMRASMSLESLAAMPPIQAQRDTYRKCGKDPSRYRGAADALARRILQGKGLYQINTAVDINNLVSLRSLHPVASYDRDTLREPITARAGRDGETYKAIGKGELNLAHLPLLADAGGPFGSATSDSERAMIRQETTRLLMVIWAFPGAGDLDQHLALASSLLQRHVHATDVETGIVT